MKLNDKIIEKSIRVSFSRDTTKQDIDELVKALKQTVEKYPI
jgi:cysteine sulfinate desulfinase/cysteine desulfurase-like protein